MFIFLIFSVVAASRLLKPDVHYYQQPIASGNYSRQAYAEMRLDYYPYPGVFAIDLRKRYKGDLSQENLNLHDFEKVIGQMNEESGCYAYQRDIEMNFQLKLDLGYLIDDPSVVFSDLATAETETKVYLIRNDFRIFEVDLSEGLKQIDLSPFNRSFASLLNYNADEDEKVYMPLAIDDSGQNRVFVISELGGVSFGTEESLTDAEIRVEDFKPRENVLSVHYNARLQLIFVALGQEGVDVYRINSEGYIEFFNQFGVSELGIQNLNIIDVDSNEDETILYLLDRENGLLIYEVQSIEKINLKMQIQISNCRHFDHWGQTFFIVARTSNQQDYAVEVFVDLRTYQYYFNNFYIDELTVNSVAVFEHYAVLIGEDAHKIVYHSIYNEFVNEDLQPHFYFEEEYLLKVKEYDIQNKQNTQNRLLAGIGMREFKYFEIALSIPYIECELQEAGTEEYYVILNSTQCEAKSEKADISPFSMCNITHQFLYTATQGAGNYTYYTKLTLTVYVLFVVLVWALVIGYALCKKWGHRIAFLKWLRLRKQAAEPYNENFEVKESEMTEQR